MALAGQPLVIELANVSKPTIRRRARSNAVVDAQYCFKSAKGTRTKIEVHNPKALRISIAGSSGKRETSKHEQPSHFPSIVVTESNSPPSSTRSRSRHVVESSDTQITIQYSKRINIRAGPVYPSYLRLAAIPDDEVPPLPTRVYDPYENHHLAWPVFSHTTRRGSVSSYMDEDGDSDDEPVRTRPPARLGFRQSLMSSDRIPAQDYIPSRRIVSDASTSSLQSSPDQDSKDTDNNSTHSEPNNAKPAVYIPQSASVTAFTHSKKGNQLQKLWKAALPGFIAQRSAARATAAAAAAKTRALSMPPPPPPPVRGNKRGRDENAADGEDRDEDGDARGPPGNKRRILHWPRPTTGNRRVRH